MDLVLTVEETAARLGLEPGEVSRLIEHGYLSAFQVGDEWRISPAALIQDLERLRAQFDPPAPVKLAPPGAQAFRTAVTLPAAKPRDPEYPDHFRVTIEVENTSDYSGDFVLFLGAENLNDQWDVERAGECDYVDGELLVRDHLPESKTITLYSGVFHGHLGDRVFLTIPEQPGVDEEIDQVFVLQDDLNLKMTLSNRGFFGKRRVKVRKL